MGTEKLNIYLNKIKFTVFEFNYLIQALCLLRHSAGCKDIEITYADKRVQVIGDLKDLSPLSRKYYKSWQKNHNSVHNLEVIEQPSESAGVR